MDEYSEIVHILSLHFDAPDFACGVLGADKNSAAFGVEEGTDSLEQIPPVLVLLDWEGIVFEFNSDAFGRQFIALLEMSLAAQAVASLHGYCYI